LHIASTSARIARVKATAAPRRAEVLQAVIASLERGIPLTVAVEGMRQPRRTVYDWLRADPDVQEAVRLARDLGYDWLAREALQIADDTSNDIVFDADGNPHPNGAAVLRAKVRIETRLKLLSKWDPTRYGDAKTVKVEGEVTQTHTIDPRLLSEEARAALRAVLEHAKARGLLGGPAPIDAEFEEAALGAEEDVPDA
jgi:hypothetical protein